jgi:hypothetical protein
MHGNVSIQFLDRAHLLYRMPDVTPRSVCALADVAEGEREPRVVRVQ